MIDLKQLKARKAQLEKEREDFVKQANAQIERLTGALILIDQLIAECESSDVKMSAG